MICGCICGNSLSFFIVYEDDKMLIKCCRCGKKLGRIVEE